MFAGQCNRRLRGALMTSFDWSVLTASLAGGLGVALIAMMALRRRTAKRHADLAQVGLQSRRRRIDVVAIDEAALRSLERTEDE
jgi:small neutral amino acid transporter SnatA (MarC family)